MKKLLLQAITLPAVLLVGFALITGPAMPDVIQGGGGLSRALANTLYCQVAGCTMTGVELMPNGSIAAPSSSFTNFTTFGLYAESGFFDLTGGESATRIMAQTAPPTALTTALVAVAGNIDAGSHSYKVTFVTASGETEGGTVSNSVVNDGTHAQNSLASVPVSTYAGVTSRKIYRNKVADQTHWFLQQTIANNTATTGVQDNTADSGLGAAMPTTNGTAEALFTVNNNGQSLFTDGAAALPGAAFAAETGTGIHRNSSGVLSVDTLGVERVRFNSSTSVTLSAALALAWGSSGAATPDTFLTRSAAATLKMGQADAASPVAQTLAFQGSRGGTDSNVAAPLATIQSPLGTGNAAGAGVAVSRAIMQASGTTAQAASHALVVCESKTLSNTSATTTTIANINLASNSGGGLDATINLVATDGTNFDSETQNVKVSYVNKAGVITIGTALISTSTAANNSGSATIGATVTGASPTISLKVTPVFTTIVPSTVTAYVNIQTFGAASTVTCQ